MPPALTNKKTTILILVWIIIFILATSLSYFYFTFSQVIVKPLPAPIETPIANSFTSPLPTPIDNSVNILLIGYGGANHSGGTLSDVLQVANINPDTKSVNIISVPRDTWVPLPVNQTQEEYQKINVAYTINADIAKIAVSKVTGLPIHYFASVSFAGFAQSIDQLGGIEVAVPVTFDDYFYPIKGKEEDLCDKPPEEMEAIHATMSGYVLEQQFTCRYEHLHFDSGNNSMDGATALKFVRSRHSDQHGGDFARSTRQKEVLLGIKNKAISLGALDNVVSFMNQFARSVRTDLTPTDVKVLLTKLGDPRDYSVKQVVLSTDNVFNNSTSVHGAYILIPKEGNNNWDAIHQYIREQIK